MWGSLLLSLWSFVTLLFRWLSSRRGSGAHIVAGSECRIPGGIYTAGTGTGACWTQTIACFLPLPQIPEHCRPSMEEGISLFSSLLNNKHFLIVFVHALEQQKDFAVRDRSG